MERTAIQIVKAFQEAGHEAYFAGGSVRDMLMEREPEDYDIATSAKPDEIEKIVDAIHLESKTIPIGKEFGVILGVVNGHHFEIATFRSDSSYSDGRRPDAVIFTSAKEDAVRRDFTINGLFYDPIKKEVLDFVEGQKDIKEKKVRFIGEAHERIKEDHLRLLRGVRFKNNFGFDYSSRTESAIRELAHLVDNVSRERVADELTKMLLHPHRSHSMKELDELTILERILPEVTAGKGVKQPTQYHQEGDVFTHVLKALHDMPEEFVSKELVWAVLLHDIGKPATFEEREDRVHFDTHAELSAKMARNVCQRMKLSKAETVKITWLIGHHMTIGLIPKMRRAHQVQLFWNPWFEDLMRLHYCDEHGSHPVDLSLYDEIMKLYEEFKSEPLLEDHFKPILTGLDLQEEFNLKPGPQLKEILEELRFAQIEGVVKDGDEARKFVSGYLSD
ncbi:CCA tRNA nucleotidyltransferase [Patescibacteria group bacterium]|nr:CCA tRNA nucleotidyltransferase [Patescibacteria group bacterium]